MASIKAILKINSEGNGIVDSYVSSVETNNTSSYPNTNNLLNFLNGMSDINKNYGGALGTPIGLNTIANLRFGVEDENGVRSDNYVGVDFGYTDNNGVLNLTLTITGTDVIAFSLVFDPLRNQYPTDYTWYDIDNNENVVTGNTSNKISFQQVAGYGITRIVFSQWALPNTMVGITYIENIELDRVLGKREIQNFNTQTQTISDPRLIQYNAIANTGDILLNDADNKLINDAKMGYLNNNIFTLDLYLNNKLIQKHITNQTPYFNSDGKINMQLTNEISKWSDYIIEETTFTDVSLYNVLLTILQMYNPEITNQYLTQMLLQDSMLLDLIYNNQIVKYQTTIFNYLSSNLAHLTFTLKKDNLINQINKICVVAQLQCYLDDNNDIRFRSARPTYENTNYNVTNPNKVIVIPFEKQISQLDYDILVSNRYQEVEIK